MALRFADTLPLGTLFAIIVCVLFLAAEIGFHLGRWHQRRTEVEEKGLNATYLGSALGLLAFMLAFTFGTAASHQSARKAVVLEEANAIGTAYLRARLLTDPSGSEIRQLLREYVDVRLAAAATNSAEGVEKGIFRSEDIHEELWLRAIELSKEHSGSIPVGLFIASLNDVIDLHSKRITAALRNRIPAGINQALVFIAVISMTMLGYQAGLAGARTLVPRLALILAFGSVLLLIAEIDRPQKTIMQTSQQAMIDLRATMANTKN